MSNPAQLVQQMLGAARSGDTDTVHRIVSDDFVWSLPGRGRIAGQVRGPDGFLSRLRTIVEAGVRPEVVDVLASEDRVAVVQRNRAEGDAGTLDVLVVNLFTVRGEQVVGQETFFDDQEQADRFWAAP